MDPVCRGWWHRKGHVQCHKVAPSLLLFQVLHGWILACAHARANIPYKCTLSFFGSSFAWVNSCARARTCNHSLLVYFDRTHNIYLYTQRERERERDTYLSVTFLACDICSRLFCSAPVFPVWVILVIAYGIACAFLDVWVCSDPYPPPPARPPVQASRILSPIPPVHACLYHIPPSILSQTPSILSQTLFRV
jgi:hypothetical protein